jgi:23S rRNA pseudouridine1911/1915/1917 synthase
VGTTHEIEVEPASAGDRLDAFVAAAGICPSRSQVRHLIGAGHVTVGGRRRKAGYLVRDGDLVRVQIPAPAPCVASAEDLPLEVLYEDLLLAAVNKAPGMVVHPAPGRWQGTLVNALLHRWGNLPAGDEVRPGIVHRLDRETSGVMVIARTAAALEHLGRQFHDRTVDKRYLAVVRGAISREELVINKPVGRHPIERKKMSTRSRTGRVAVTRVRVLERLRGATLVEASPETGRTHQIRVHLAAQGHPILGDAVYGRTHAAGAVPVMRLALHASSLAITHPESGLRLSFVAPLWPDMVQLLAALRAQNRDG